MKVDFEASDPAGAPAHGPEEQIEELLAAVREELRLGLDRPWRLISTRPKLKKIFFEVEESGPDGIVRIIGKVSRSDRSRQAFASLQQIWNAGFKPPSLYTVVRPIAYLEHRKVLLQEKAPGVQLLETLRSGDASAEELTRRAAKWLVALHRAPLVATPFEGEASIAEKCSCELENEVPAAARIRALCKALLKLLLDRKQIDRVPSHGDFHSMNVFLEGSGRVTAIDFDDFSARERCADVAYFFSQAAIIGYLHAGSFSTTETFRLAFLEEYEQTSRCRLDRRRLALYVALAFLQSLHFEFCILRTRNTAVLEPWLRSAEQCIEGDLDLG